MNENILILNDLNTGNNIKQGDRTILKYLCDDGNGDSLDFTGKLARAVLKTRKNQVIYQTEAQINDRNEVTFIIDRVIPATQYVLEIIIDNQYIFPSDNTMYLNVTKSSLGAFEDYIEQTPREELYKAIDERIGEVGRLATVEYVDESLTGLATKEEIENFITDESLTGLATKEEVKDHLTADELKDIYLQDYATTEYVDDKVSGLASTEYVDGKVSGIDLSGFATKDILANYVDVNDLSGYAVKDDLTGLATTEYVDNKVDSVDLSSYATTAYVDDKVTGLATTEYVDSLDISDQLANYATKEYVDSLDVTDQLAEYAKTDYVDNEISNIDLSSYATKADLENIELTEAQKAELKGDPGKSVQVWKGTGDEYTTLENKDPDTIYLIKEG